MTADKKSKTPKTRKPRPAAKTVEAKSEAVKPAAATSERKPSDAPAAAKYVAPDTTKVPPGIERMRAAREAKAVAEPAPAAHSAPALPKPVAPAAIVAPPREDKPVEAPAKPAVVPSGLAPKAPVVHVAPHREPTRAEITDRAYQIYRKRGMTPGNPEADWLQAERELREEFAQHLKS